MTREEAVNWLTNITDDIGEIEHLDLWHYEEALKEIKGILESEQSESQWISVMERLPEIKQRVLITYNTEDGLKTDVTWYDKYGFMLSGDVTAWMPMVKPYKEENGE